MPPKARVFVAEDSSDWQEMIEEILAGKEHAVVAKATTRNQALEIAKKLKDLNVNVATVDGNLNDYDSDGSDGRAVVKAIREHAPEVKIVGFSGDRDVDLGADIKGWKGDAINLADIVTNL